MRPEPEEIEIEFGGLRIPMRGYEVLVAHALLVIAIVTNPHEGL